ncbi:MAG: hypothetical protein FH756_16345 [Firmicutes bacterium]|nr:hypothetical protein [Bacillota bacterium]
MTTRRWHNLKGKFVLNAVVGIILALTLFIGQAPAEAVPYQDQFDAADTFQVWQNGYTNDSGGLAWNRSYVMESFMIMYKQTGDTRYLDRFVIHADQTLAARDSVRGVTNYKGESLPAWRAGARYTTDGSYYNFAVHTGMLSYPLADFADVVYSNNLTQYMDKAAEYLKAAKDAVAIHADHWRESGNEGWYINPKGAPYEADGMGIPFNQYLAMARAELAIYRASGEQVYLDHATKMARHFKNRLMVTSDNAYYWYYTWGPFLNGWTAADGLSANTPSYSGYKAFEDLGHGTIDVSFAYLAFENGIVFNEQDMQRFGNTIEQNLIRPDGQVNKRVNGGGGILSPPAYIGMWLQYSQYAPSLFDFVDNSVNNMDKNANSLVNLLVTARLCDAAVEKDNGNDGETPGDGNENPGNSDGSPASKLVNGDFNSGRTGWSGTEGSVLEENSNGYASVNYSWQFYQDVAVTPGKSYVLSGETRLGTAGNEARVVAYLIDGQGNPVDSKEIRHKHSSYNWEQLSELKINVPSTVNKLRVYLLVNGGSGTHDFDNISLSEAGSTAPETPQDTENPQVLEFTPADGASIDSGQTFRAVFSEDVSGVNESSFFIENVPGTVTYDSTTYMAELTPNAPLAEGETYRVNLDDGITDKAGNGLEARVYSFKVPDITAPEVTVVTPANNDKVSGSVTLEAHAEDNVDVTSLSFQVAGANGTWETLGSGTLNNGQWFFDWDTADNTGLYLIRAVARDGAGNETVSEEVKVNVLNRTEPTPNGGIVDGSFNNGGNGWTTSGGELAQESNGNIYAKTGYSWQFYQDVAVTPGKNYVLNGETRFGTARTEARVVAYLIDGQGNPVDSKQIRHKHSSYNWEQLSELKINVPSTVNKLRVYLLVNGGSGTHDFDNISLSEAGSTAPETPQDTENPQVLEFTPADGASIDSGQTFRAVFSEDVSGVNESSFFIENVPGTVTYDSTTYMAELTPNAPLAEGETYRVNLDDGITDKAGNGLEARVYSFKVPDITAPEVTVVTPANNDKVSGSVTLEAHAEDNVDVTSLSFQVAGANGTWETLGSGTLNNGQWFFDWDTADNTGLYLIRAVARDGAGNETVSEEVKVNVLNRTEPTPNGGLINGDFSNGGSGWTTSGGELAQGSNGNIYASAGYSWQFYQDVDVAPGKNYVLSGETRFGTARTEARVVAYLLDGQGNPVDSKEIRHKHSSYNWEQLSDLQIRVPSTVNKLRIYLLVNGGSGTHDFDNISLVPQN